MRKREKKKSADTLPRYLPRYSPALLFQVPPYEARKLGSYVPHYHMSVGDVQSVIITHTAAIQALSHSRCVERHKLMGDGWDLLKATPPSLQAWGSLCDPEELVEPPTSPISSAYTADLSLLSGKWKLAWVGHCYLCRAGHGLSPPQLAIGRLLSLA